MVVGITGATGFIGGELARRLMARGDQVVGLTRDVEQRRTRRAAAHWHDIDAVQWRHFDPLGGPQPEAFEGLDAVVNLAGESISGRWTPDKKRAIRESRLDGTRYLVASIAQLARRPTVLVSASAVGYYGARGDEPLDESAPPGRGYLADVCIGWEAAADEARALGVRVVTLRQGIVLGDGGALAAMVRPFQFFAGGPLGSGRQWWPWIHVDDVARLILLALEDARVTGPINAVAPDYATNARFTQALGNALGRPALLPAPSFALRLVLGEFAESLLTGQLVIPARALDLGFAFEHDSLERALIEVNGDPRRSPGTHRFASSQYVPQPPEKVFTFFSDPRNLAGLTPAAFNFRIVSAPAKMQRGAIIDYALRVRGVPARWRTMVTEWHPIQGFTDVQLRGPFALWRHRHRLGARNGGTLIHDDIEYSLPLAPLGELAARLVRAELDALFSHRRDRIERLFARS